MEWGLHYARLSSQGSHGPYNWSRATWGRGFRLMFPPSDETLVIADQAVKAHSAARCRTRRADVFSGPQTRPAT